MLSKIITDADFFGGDPMYLGRIERYASRGVLISDRNEVALLYAKRLYCYKLPGGGVRRGESAEDALHRELLEETGCKCNILRKLGTVEEHKIRRSYMQLSTAFIARVVGDPEEPRYTSAERRIGLELRWISMDEAVEIMRREYRSIDEYGKKFLIARDLAILEYAYSHFDEV